MPETSPSEVTAPATASVEPWERVRLQLDHWNAEAKALKSDARALAPLAKERSYKDLSKLPALLDKLDAKLRKSEGAVRRGITFIEQFQDELRRRAETRRVTLAAKLKQACEQVGLEMLVVRREEPVEVRIPPFAVEIDRVKGRATLRFGRLPIDTCSADAEPIVTMVTARQAAWSKGFEPATFFEACRRAWSAARASGLGASTERVEIVDLMPFVALQLQPKKFLLDPTAKNYLDYSRAHFAFDLMQLRRANLLSHDGWRLNLGVATGTSASDKKRVVFVEDEHGNGEFKLTLFFTRA